MVVDQGNEREDDAGEGGELANGWQLEGTHGALPYLKKENNKFDAHRPLAKKEFLGGFCGLALPAR